MGQKTKLTNMGNENAQTAVFILSASFTLTIIFPLTIKAIIILSVIHINKIKIDMSSIFKNASALALNSTIIIPFSEKF